MLEVSYFPIKATYHHDQDHEDYLSSMTNDICKDVYQAYYLCDAHAYEGKEEARKEVQIYADKQDMFNLSVDKIEILQDNGNQVVNVDNYHTNQIHDGTSKDRDKTVSILNFDQVDQAQEIGSEVTTGDNQENYDLLSRKEAPSNNKAVCIDNDP